MNLKIILLFITLFCIISNSIAQKIFETKYVSQADVKIYIVNKKSKCDLKVHYVDYTYQAKENDGLWFEVDYAYQADVKVHFVKYEQQSDITIFKVKHKYDAGWVHKKKKHFFRYAQ